MKTKIGISEVLNIVLLVAIIVVLTFPKTTVSSADQGKHQASTLEIIHARKSVRHFQVGKSVSQTLLDTLARAGMAAPSAMNKQPWAFVCITDRAVLDQLAEANPHATMLNTASAAIVVCGDMNKTIEGDAQTFWVQDCSAATENILLAAESLGLGAVWTGGYPAQERVTTISQILHLPENIIPLNVIVLGYPNGEDKPKDKYNKENIHFNKW